MYRTTEQWIDEYKQKDALWIHSGDATDPHACLTSGMHSNGFFNSRLVIPDEQLLREAASDLLELFEQNGGDAETVQVVVGPQTGATKLAELLSKRIGSLIKRHCASASPAKHEQDGIKSMLFPAKDLREVRDRIVLLCEDVLTTGGSVNLAANATRKARGIVLPYILTLVNRSGLTEIEGKKIVALIDRPMPMWQPEECPLCKKGSEALRPKENWARLNDTH